MRTNANMDTRIDLTKIQKEHARAAGYTLVEMVIVLAIISLLVGASAKLLGPLFTGAKGTRVKADLEMFTTALLSYESQAGRLPTSAQGLKALVARPTEPPRPRSWAKAMKKLPNDPWNQPYVYRFPGKFNPDEYDIFSLGRDGVESADDIGNWEPEEVEGAL